MSIFESMGQSKKNEDDLKAEVAPDFKPEDSKFNFQHEFEDGTMGFYETEEEMIKAIQDNRDNSN